MLPLDPIGLAPAFSQAGEIAKKKDKKKETENIKTKSFSSLLETSQEQTSTPIHNANNTPDIEGKSFDETLQLLVDSVYTAGDRLKKNPSTEEFKEYRKSLSYFLNFVVKNTYEIETYQRRRGKKHVVYTLVTLTNEKLDKLASDILFNQADQLRILARVEEINGILVDFFS